MKVFNLIIKKYNLQIWQFVPEYCDGHKQTKPFPEIWQVPPFEHGFVVQALATKNRNSQIYI